MVHLRLRDFNLGLGVTEVCGGEVEIRLRNELLPEQGLHTIEFEFPLIRHVLRFRQIAMPALERCAGLTHPRLERLRIDRGQDLALRDHGIEVRHQLGNFAGDLAAHLHRHDRIDRAGGGDNRGDGASIDQRSVVVDRRSSSHPPIPGSCPDDREEDRDADVPGKTEPGPWWREYGQGGGEPVLVVG